jgi:2-haloacid dehalogenase
MGLAAGRVRVLIFDVLGTVVDESGSAAAEFEAAIRDATGEAGHGEQLARAWLNRSREMIEAITAGMADWSPMDDVNYYALVDAVAAQGLRLPEATLRALAQAQQRMRPWPDVLPGLTALSQRFLVVALSNANLATLAEMGRHAGLAWDCVLSGELAGAYKPDPRVYAMALELLRIEPDEAVFVAAHAWDLRAAAAAGLPTAYVERPGVDGATPQDSFDLRAADFESLAAQLPR